MARILNKAELDRLVELGILKINAPFVGDADSLFYRGAIPFLNFENSINAEMIGQKVKTANGRFTVLPWMIKKNWKNTRIFNEE